MGAGVYETLQGGRYNGIRTNTSQTADYVNLPSRGECGMV